MKRKQAFAFNAPGPTSQYLSMSEKNAYSCGAMSPVTLSYGVDCYGGVDYSYSNIYGGRSSAFRSKFKMWDFGMFELDSPCYDSIFRLGRFGQGCGAARLVYYFFGVRVVLEYFDVNAIADFTGVLEPGASIAAEMRRFQGIYTKQGFRVTILNNHLINIEL